MIYESNGEANNWRIKDAENHWFAIVQLNGELTEEKQRKVIAHFAAAPEMKTLLRDSVQWLGKMIADKGHEQSVMPNHCVNTMMKIEALLSKLDTK